MSAPIDKSKRDRSHSTPRTQTKTHTNSFTKKNRHRFNRAGDIADDIASALYSRDPAHRDNPNTKKRLSRINNRIDGRRDGPAADHQTSDSRTPDSHTPDSHTPDAVNRIWDACCSRCLGLQPPGSPENTVTNNAPSNSEPVRERQNEAIGAQLVWIDADEAVVYAQSPIWATRVRMLAPSLVACMRQSGLNEISRLRVRVEPLETVPIPRARPMVPMTPESGEILSEAADRSRDDDLAGRLKKLARHAQKKD